MSEITPEKVAAAVCEGIGGWRHRLQAALSLTAEGNVLSLALTRWDGPDDTETVRHFRAHVFEVPAAGPVAAEPVVLDAETARELACSGVGESFEGWTVVANEEFDHARWESIHLLVIRNDAGEHFKDTYRQGLTEGQDSGPYEYRATATFTPAVPSMKVVQSFEWVRAEAAQAEKGGTDA